jgi:hypothetical protein
VEFHYRLFKFGALHSRQSYFFSVTYTTENLAGSAGSRPFLQIVGGKWPFIRILSQMQTYSS